MVQISDNDFKKIASEAIDSLPDEILDNMQNIAIVIEDEPSKDQLKKLHIVDGWTLFGLYEGIPLTARGNNYNLVLPDKITIFKKPICLGCENINELKHQLKRTIWHEIAHHYGLNHDDINRRLKEA